MKRFLQICLITAITFSFSIFAKAQTKISDEKRKIIAELIALTKADKQIYQITDSAIAVYEKQPPITVETMLGKNNNLNPAQRIEMQKILDVHQQSFSRKFRERLPQTIDFSKYIENSIYPLYDKFFSESELRDLVTFYKTPTGQKVIGTMPMLAAESLQNARTVLTPQISELIETIIQEEVRDYAQEERQLLKQPQTFKQPPKRKTN